MRSKRAADPHEGSDQESRAGSLPSTPPHGEEDAAALRSHDSSSPSDTAPSAPNRATAPTRPTKTRSNANSTSAPRKRSSTKAPAPKAPDGSPKRRQGGAHRSESPPDGAHKRTRATASPQTRGASDTDRLDRASVRTNADTHAPANTQIDADTQAPVSAQIEADTHAPASPLEHAPSAPSAPSAAGAAGADTRAQSAPWTSRESLPEGIMPYEPSAPCAACARGVDPLRAACVSVTEHSVHYFCSRRCQETYLRAEAEHEQRLAAQAARTPVSAQPAPADERVIRADARAPSTSPPRRLTIEPVARRVAPAKPSTPWWPLGGATLCAIAAFAPIAGAPALSAFVLVGLAVVFASRTPHTRHDGGVLAWFSGPLAIGLLALAALLGPGSFAGARPTLVAACAGIVLLWLREHLLERAIAARRAQHTELTARLSTRVQVALPDEAATRAPAARARTASAPASLALGTHTRFDVRSEMRSPSVERALESLREGDEVVCEAGTVIPVDGIVSAGTAEVLPYLHARAPLERTRGDAVLAGALVLSGPLRIHTLRVGERRALFGVLRESAEPSSHDSWALAIADHARSLQGALLGCVSVLLVALLSPQPAAAKLAGVAAALLALPALTLARGLRSVFRAAVLGAAARGVRFWDASVVERAGRIDTAVLRVEGVLVPRVYTLVQVVSLSDTHDTNALLALALAAGSTSEDGAPGYDVTTHAIARAVRDHARQRGVAPAVLRRIVFTRGLGVSGLTDGQGPLVFGSRAALLSAGVSVAIADRDAQRAESSGQRVVFLALGGRVRGLLLFTQALRVEARAAVQTLFDLGLELTLASGDHRATVDSLARTLDITQVKAELSAEQRAAEVHRLCDGEAHVVALGRAPADEAMLTNAQLSLCLDAAGQPHHHEAGQAVTYDITTASDDLRDAVAALVLARRARRAVWRVLGAAAAALVAGLLGAGGLLPPLLVVLIAGAVDLVCLDRQPGFGGRRWGATAAREDAAV